MSVSRSITAADGSARDVSMAILASLLPGEITAQHRDEIHDQSYVNPTWGYSVRWYDDEWTIAEETSDGGADSLWLSDGDGNVVGFEGWPSYDGDAAACREDLIASVEDTPGATDIAVVQDEEEAPQASWDARWSWIALLVRLPENDMLVDNVVYLDCRTLAPDESVLARMLAGPASTFQEDAERFDVLQASLPHSAWLFDPDYGGLTAGTKDQGQASRFFDVDRGGFPRSAKLLFDAYVDNSIVDTVKQAMARAHGIWEDTGDGGSACSSPGHGPHSGSPSQKRPRSPQRMFCW